MADPKCVDLVNDAFNRMMDAIDEILVNDDIVRAVSEYGLAFDYVKPHTFKGQRKGYHQWLLSWGGPSSEVRYFENGGMIEFWYMDWFDGAKKVVAKDTPAFEKLHRCFNLLYWNGRK